MNGSTLLRVRLRFPLGVYNARSASEDAEWPPSPLRLIGALLAAAHERPGAEPDRDRALLQLLCEAQAPLVIAPDSVAVGEQIHGDEVVKLRGATRWAPRNYVTGPISPRNLGRERAEVNKAGVAIGDRSVAIEWRDLDLNRDEVERLSILASEVAFLGTTRSPVVVDVGTTSKAEDIGEEAALDTWTPNAGDGVRPDVTLRVPNARAIADFDRRHQARRSRKAKVEKAGIVPEISIGTPLPYTNARRRRAEACELDPHWWGEMIVLEIDRQTAETLPKAPAAYLLARAVRIMLLGAFDDEGTTHEAPPILRARGADPHCAIVPLPHVWGDHPDGLIRGVALILPHVARVPDLGPQLNRLAVGLDRCLAPEPGAEPRYVKIPGSGKMSLKFPDAGSTRRPSFREDLYVGPARRWVSVTPIVHSRWRKGGIDALLDQVAADCAHVGLPAPIDIELLRAPGRRGGADQILPPPPSHESWRGLLQGPTSHMRLTFPQPVLGPILIGRARHFGLGLCLPDDRNPSESKQAR